MFRQIIKHIRIETEDAVRPLNPFVWVHDGARYETHQMTVRKTGPMVGFFFPGDMIPKLSTRSDLTWSKQNAISREIGLWTQLLSVDNRS
jgi:hypothetical protein